MQEQIQNLKKNFYTGRQTWQFDYVVKNEIVN